LLAACVPRSRRRVARFRQDRDASTRAAVLAPDAGPAFARFERALAVPQAGRRGRPRAEGAVP